jgi:hypothetical protein
VSSLARPGGLGRSAAALAASGGLWGGFPPPLAVQPPGHLLRIPLGIQRQQPGEHVVAHGIGPAVAPGQLAAAGDGATGLQLPLEIEDVAGLPEEQLAAVDALLEVVGELGVFFDVDVVEAEATSRRYIASAVALQHRLIHLAVEPAQFRQLRVGLGGIVEAVASAGEAFVVLHP